MMIIWKRYFIAELLKVFFLFLFCFYGLYVLIDYTTHASNFHVHQSDFRWKEFIVYYLSEFIHRSDILVPLGLLVASLRTLTKLNQHNELTALRAAGIPLITLMTPFLYAGLFFTTLLFANEEWLLPHSRNVLKKIQDSHSSEKRKLHNTLAAQYIALQDESTLIYQKYDSSRNLFFDAYWIRSADEIFRIKYLQPLSTPPLGKHIDRLKRDSLGVLQIDSSSPSQEFPSMVFNKTTLLETLMPIEDLPLTKLWKKWPPSGVINSDKEAQVVTALYSKLILPWFCFFAILAPIPACIRFSRQASIFLLYALSIFGFVSIYLIFDSAQILAKRQVVDPAPILWIPFLLFSSFFLWRFLRINR